MSAHTSILVGGLFHVAIAVFHLLFWRLFDWQRDLTSLRFVNRQAMQILNLCMTFVFLAVAWLSFAHAAGLLTTPLGRTLLLLIATFWALRATYQVVFFGLRNPTSAALFVATLAGGALYAVPWLVTRAGFGGSYSVIPF
jgi:hypothetical protein